MLKNHSTRHVFCQTIFPTLCHERDYGSSGSRCRRRARAEREIFPPLRSESIFGVQTLYFPCRVVPPLPDILSNPITAAPCPLNRVCRLIPCPRTVRSLNRVLPCIPTVRNRSRADLCLLTVHNPSKADLCLITASNLNRDVRCLPTARNRSKADPCPPTACSLNRGVRCPRTVCSPSKADPWRLTVRSSARRLLRLLP